MNAHEVVVREAAIDAARTLERLAAPRRPLTPGQVLAVAMKIRRDLHAL